jgi:hypothetical protein
VAAVDALQRHTQIVARRHKPVDVVVYETRHGEQRFGHLRPDGGRRVEIAEPATYREFALEERSVILKLHGDVDRQDPESDTSVVTEDDYIDYLAGQSVRALVPAYLIRRLRESELLFLGSSMRD